MSKVYINMQISGFVSASALASFMGQVEQEGPHTLSGASGAVEPETVEEKPSAKPAAEEKPKATPESKPNNEAPAAETRDGPRFDYMKAAAQKLVAANGREALAELLTDYDAKNLSSVPEGKRAEFIEAIDKKIA